MRPSSTGGVAAEQYRHDPHQHHHHHHPHPPEVRNSIMSGFVTLIRESRTLTVVLIALYTLYVQIAASITKNWANTREMGFAQPDYCNSVSNTYGIAEYDLQTDDTTATKPLVYQNYDPDHICFTKLFLENCMTTLDNTNTGNSIEQFTSFFNRANRNYFPLAAFTTALTFIILLFTILYETQEEFFIPAAEGGGTFFPRTLSIDRRMVIKVNHLLCISLTIVLMISSSFPLYLYEEDCSDLYKNEIEDPSYCITMNDCGMVLISIVFPNDFIANNFNAINLTFAIILTITMLLRCMTYDHPPSGNAVLPTVAGSEQNHHDDEDGLNTQLTLYSQNRSSANQRLRLQLEFTLTGNRGIVTRSALSVHTVPKRPNWKEYTLEEHQQLNNVNNNESECPICLSAIKFLIHSNNLPNNLNSATSDRNANTLNRVRSTFSRLPTTEDEEENEDDRLPENDLSPRIEGKTDLLVEEYSSAGTPIDSSRRKEQVIVKAQCSHIFHEYCIQEWFRNHDTCPVCRNTLHRQEEGP